MTQQTRTYAFPFGENMLHLIDTPGIGDTRGDEADKANFENIMKHLTYYEEIHAICILLKPNEARLNLMFKYCIQELLGHLHMVSMSIKYIFVDNGPRHLL